MSKNIKLTPPHLLMFCDDNVNLGYDLLDKSTLTTLLVLIVG